MPQFRLHLEWDGVYGSRDIAKQDLQAIWEEIESLAPDDDKPTLEVFDVVPHPAKGGGLDYPTLPTPDPTPSDNRIVNSLVPPFEVTHPWDQGIMIFPDDHPLHGVEQAARNASMPTDQRHEMQRELLEAQRALPQTTDPLENDTTP